jgi:hypothetical protein
MEKTKKAKAQVNDLKEALGVDENSVIKDVPKAGSGPRPIYQKDKIKSGDF